MPLTEHVERIVYEGVDKISNVSRQVADSQKRLAQSIDAVKTVLASVGVTVGAGALVNLTLDAIKATAALDDMAEATGASVEQLSVIQRVARIGGQDFEGLTGQLGKMVKGLREGTEEGGRAARAFAFLDVKTREADGRFRDTAAILQELADKLARYEDGGNKVALVQDALGKGAERYLPLLKDLAENTERQAVVTAKQAAEAERLEKNINRITGALVDHRRAMVASATPAMVDFTDKLLEANRAGGFFLATLRAMSAAASVLPGPLGLPGRAAAGLIDAQARPGGGASQADVRRVENAMAAPLTYNPSAPQQAKPEGIRGEPSLDFVDADAEFWAKVNANRLAADKSLYDARAQAMIEFHDRQQLIAIEMGAAELEAAGESHSLKLELLRQEFLTEEELEIEEHAKRLERLAQFSAEELETLGGHNALKEQLEQQHRARLNSIRSRSDSQVLAMMKAARAGDLAAATGHFTALTAVMATHSRSWFEINKAAGVANVAVKGIEAVMNSYAWGSTWGGPVGGAAMAAIAALFYTQQAAAIASQKFGGGTAPSLAGSTPAMPVTPVESAAPAAAAGPTRQIELVIRGEGAAGRMIAEDLMRQMTEVKKDGGFPELFSVRAN